MRFTARKESSTLASTAIDKSSKSGPSVVPVRAKKTGPSQPVKKESDPNLEALLVAIGENQDRAAFSKLFNATASRLKGFAMQSGSTASDAEELLQECMMTVWRKAHTFNPKNGTAITWLFTILRNKRIDFARKGRYNAVMSDDLWPEETGEELDVEVAGDLDAAVARSLLHALPEQQRQVVFKVYFEGKSHSEIAADLDLPLGTIKSRLRLAMNKLDVIAKENMSWLIIILLMNY